LAGNSQDHDTLLKKQALHKARNLVEKIEQEDASLGWQKEKQLLLLLGVVAIAVVGFVGLSMMMGGSKEKDLERHRCEQDFVVKSVWDYTEELKKKYPAAASGGLAGEVDKKRAEFKEAAKAACAKGK
jgi:hypothetical protein